MKERFVGNMHMANFASLDEFYKYICDTPFNEPFRWVSHSSVKTGNANWAGTNNFEEAVELMKNGWQDMSKKLTKMLSAKTKNFDIGTKQKSVYDVAGFQCSVPRYLQGVPTSMINKKNVPAKQKVITITKIGAYNMGVTTEEIMQESVKVMALVKKLESQGVRVNLNVMFGGTDYYGNIGVAYKIRLKSSGEKLNVSKLAFPMVHPSMLRRLYLRYAEVCPHTPSSFTSGYGKPITVMNGKKLIEKDEYLLPAFITKDINTINSIDDLKGL